MIQSTLSMSHQEWLEDRRKGIGGSDVATILGLNQYKSAYQLWLEKTGQVELKDTESDIITLKLIQINRLEMACY